MLNVNSTAWVRFLLLLGVQGASTTSLSASKVNQKTFSGSKSSAECSTSDPFDPDPSDFTSLLQTGTHVRPAAQHHNSRVKQAAITATSKVKGSSFVQTAHSHVPSTIKHQTIKHQTTFDAQEKMFQAMVTLAQDYRSPYKYVYEYNATSGTTSLSKVVVEQPGVSLMTCPVVYTALFLLIVIVSASLYLDTLQPRRESSVDQDISKLDPMFTGASKQQELKGLARRSHKSLGNSEVGLLKDDDRHSPKAGCGPYAGVGKGGNESSVYNMLARLPGLHLFGGSFLLLVVLPRLYPTSGMLLQLALLLYGMLKFALTGLWTAHGLSKISQQEKLGSLQYERLQTVQSVAAHSGDYNVDGPDAAAGADTIRSVQHCVVIPCYKEAVSTISATLQTLTEQTVASQIIVVLAMEARDQEAKKTAQTLTEQFKSQGLAALFHTFHELGGNEAPGKSSNENWAFRCGKRWLCDSMGYPLEKIVFTTCDADTYFHPQHFEYLSHLFLKSAEPHRSVWQGAVCALPNSYALPALSSVRYVMLSLGYLGQLANEASIIGNFPLGIYSMSAKLAHEVGYWDPTVVPEDWHMFFRVNLEAPTGNVRCVPMYTVVGNLGVEGSTYWESLKGCYKQSVRWQWGGISMGYLLMQLFQSKCPFWRRLSLIFGHYEHHFLLPLVWLSAVSLPVLYSRECIHLQPFTPQKGAIPHTPWNVALDPVCHKDSVTMGQICFVAWMFFLVCNWITVIVLDWWYRSIVKGRTHFERVPQGAPTLSMALMFLMFPVTDFFFHVIPTWHAYLRMFLSTGFEYEVAAKGAVTGESLGEAQSVRL